MSLPRKAPFLWLLLTLFYQHSTLTTAETHTREKICPNAEDIAPCTCTVDDGILHKNLNMMCEDIADEQQLYDIFHSDIPDTKFHWLLLDTHRLESLGADVFGDVTFEDVHAYSFYALQGLSSVHPATFIKSKSTLRRLDLYGNSIIDFPFDTLSNYTELLTFSILDYLLESFPIIESKTIRFLFVNFSPISVIPSGALDGLPNLWSFNADDTVVSQVPDGLFASLSKLKTIDLGFCNLDHLTSAQFEVNSTTLQSIFLSHNEITKIEPGTFKGIQSGKIDLWNNTLTILPEDTWKPVFDAGNTVSLSGNPLTCGCDVAWLVLEPSYHQFVEDASCANGDGLLVDLDPTWFEDNC